MEGRIPITSGPRPVLPLEPSRPLADRLRRLLAGIGFAAALAGLVQAALAVWAVGFPPQWVGVDRSLWPVFLISFMVSCGVDAALFLAALGLATRKTGWSRPLLLVYAVGALGLTVIWVVAGSINSAPRQGSALAVQVGRVLTLAADNVPGCALALLLAGLLLRRAAAEPTARENPLVSVTPERFARVLCVVGLLIAGSTAAKLAVQLMLYGIESLSLRVSLYSLHFFANTLTSASSLIEAAAAAVLLVGAVAWMRGHRWGRMLLPAYALLWILAAASKAAASSIFFVDIDWANTSPPTPSHEAERMRWYFVSAQIGFTLLASVHAAMTLWCLRWPEFRGRGPATSSAFEPILAGPGEAQAAAAEAVTRET